VAAYEIGKEFLAQFRETGNTISLLKLFNQYAMLMTFFAKKGNLKMPKRTEVLHR
jgi:hypothetical protein